MSTLATIEQVVSHVGLSIAGLKPLARFPLCYLKTLNRFGRWGFFLFLRRMRRRASVEGFPALCGLSWMAQSGRLHKSLMQG